MSDLLSALARDTGIMPTNLQQIANTAPKRYKSFTIPKRTGGRRTISQPSTELKIVQRALVRILLNELPIHSAATAYRKTMSIRDNALPHAGHRPILKMDFKDFFPSITARDWRSYCQSRNLLDDRDIGLSSNLLFRRERNHSLLRLAIGAPSSPTLSNILMYDFDVKITEFLGEGKVIYTRYADDLTFSAERTGYLNSVHKHLREALRETKFPTLKINNEKTTLITTKYGRRVTGLTLSNDGRITIGHPKKRELRSAIHRAKLNKLNVDELETLAGNLAFVNAVEPEYLEKLMLVYGGEIVKKILRTKRRRKYQHTDLTYPF